MPEPFWSSYPPSRRSLPPRVGAGAALWSGGDACVAPARATSHAQQYKRTLSLSMSTENNQQRLEAMYGQLWSILFPGGELFTALSQSLHPRPPTMLYDLVGALGVTADSLVLDASCGQGQHSGALARQFGCQVIGLDLVATNLDQARATAKQEGLSEQVSFLQGEYEICPGLRTTLTSSGVVICWSMFKGSKPPLRNSLGCSSHREQ